MRTGIGAAAASSHTQAVVLLLDGEDASSPSLLATNAALALAQYLAALVSASHLTILTCGGRGSKAAHGGSWGLARVLRLEHASLHTQSVDLVRGPEATAAILGPAMEDEAAWRGRTCNVARLRECSTGSMQAGHAIQGLYTVTGGLGGLGLRAATLLIDSGARCVLLASRSGRVVRDGQGLETQLQALGSAGKVVACDSADACDVKALIFPHLPSGVLHAAGAGDKGLLSELAARRVGWLQASKALGAWHMHCVSAATPLETLVLFSSVGSGLGNIGQANYAAANACLDAQALSRRADGAAACSLQWPLVGGAGIYGRGGVCCGGRASGFDCWDGGHLARGVCHVSWCKHRITWWLFAERAAGAPLECARAGA